MFGQPPPERLDFGIPGITGPVRVTVVTSALQQFFNGSRHFIFHHEIIRPTGYSDIFFGRKELRAENKDDACEEDFLEHLTRQSKGKVTAIRTFVNLAVS